MAQTGQDFTIYSGDDGELDFTLTDASGGPLDLTGATAEWLLASGYSETPLVMKTSTISGEITITDAVGGLLSVFLASADTSELGGEPYQHELRITDGSGNTVTVATGAVTISPTIF